MRRAAFALPLALGLLLLAGGWSSAEAKGRHHGHRGHGHHYYGHGHHYGHHGHHGHYSSHFFIGLGPYVWGPPVWYGPRYYDRTVVIREPVYVEREPAPGPPAAYWYYCESAGAYYPNVTSCPEPWVKVPPRAE